MAGSEYMHDQQSNTHPVGCFHTLHNDIGRNGLGADHFQVYRISIVIEKLVNKLFKI